MAAKTVKAKNGAGEYRAFSDALRRVLRVSHSDMKRRLDEEKKAKANRRRTSSSRASGDKG